MGRLFEVASLTCVKWWRMRVSYRWRTGTTRESVRYVFRTTFEHFPARSRAGVSDPVARATHALLCMIRGAIAARALWHICNVRGPNLQELFGILERLDVDHVRRARAAETALKVPVPSLTSAPTRRGRSHHSKGVVMRFKNSIAACGFAALLATLIGAPALAQSPPASTAPVTPVCANCHESAALTIMLTATARRTTPTEAPARRVTATLRCT